MLIIHGLNKSQSLFIKKSRREKLNSAISQKNFKNTFISFDNHSNNISQPQNKINNKYFNEESKVNFYNNSNGMGISEKEKFNLKKSLIFPLRFYNTNKKLNTEKGNVSKQMEYENRYKNKCVFLTYKGNPNVNDKKRENKPININKFINEINSFLLPNEKTFENLKNLINYRIIYKESIKAPDLEKLLKRYENQDKQIIYELFYKYIIKRTFKELLKIGNFKNSLIDKNQIRKEYQKQLNEIKEYLKLQNKEFTKGHNNNIIELSEKRKKISTAENLRESRRSFYKNYKIVDIEKSKRRMTINHNNSSDVIFHIHNFDKESDELENQNVKYINQELNKKKFEAFLSLPENNKINYKNSQLRKYYMLLNNNTKEHHSNSSLDDIKAQPYIIPKIKIENNKNDKVSKLKITYPKENPIIITKKPKTNNISDNTNNTNMTKNNNSKNKKDIQFKTEISDKKKPQIKEFNVFLGLHNIHNKNNKNNNNNDDIIYFLDNKEKMVKFTNKILNEHINNKKAYKGKKFVLNLNYENHDSIIKEDFEHNNISNTKDDNSETFNNSTNLENFFNEKELKIEPQPRYRSFLIKNSSSQKNSFDGKFSLNENFFKENNQIMQKLNKNIYPSLFNKASDYSIKDEKIKLKNLNRLLKRKLFIKKKKAKKGRSFKDFLKDEISQENTGINQEEIKVNENKNIKITKHTDEEKDLIEKEWESKFKTFKKYVQKLKNMSKDEFLDDTFKFIKQYE